MRRPLTLFAALLIAASPAGADQTDKRLERLFQQLTFVRTSLEAAELERQITVIWTRSGSDTADVLMARAANAIDAQDLTAARKLLDVLVEMRPGTAQVWYRHGELMLAIGARAEAESDFAKTLELEPRHFPAHAALGRIAELNGDKAKALAAYRKAVALNPMMEALARRAGQLAYELERKPH